MTDYMAEYLQLRANGTLRSATPADGEKYKDHLGLIFANPDDATEIEPYKYAGNRGNDTHQPSAVKGWSVPAPRAVEYIQHNTPRSIAGAWCVEHAQRSQGFEYAIRFKVLTEDGSTYGTYLWHPHGWQWL